MLHTWTVDVDMDKHNIIIGSSKFLGTKTKIQKMCHSKVLPDYLLNTLKIRASF